MNDVSTAPVVEVRIDSIIIGERRRQKLGRLKPLATSIRAHGLIHPIMLRGNTLVAGHRRLEACRSLQWKTITARQVDRLSDDELRAIELDENDVREALSTFAASKARLAQIRQAEADLKAKAAEEAKAAMSTLAQSKSGQAPKKLSRRGRRGEGRPKGAKGAKPTQEAVAEATGVDPKTQRETERHVTLAENYPFLQRHGWVMHSVLEAGVELDRLPAGDRSQVAALLDQDAIPPKASISIIKNVAAMDVALRRELFEQASSDDEHERRIALTRAAAVPPPVDPGLTLLGDAESALRRAAKVCRASEFKPLIETLATDAARIYGNFQEANADARRVSPASEDDRTQKSA